MDCSFSISIKIPMYFTPTYSAACDSKLNLHFKKLRIVWFIVAIYDTLKSRRSPNSDVSRSDKIILLFARQTEKAKFKYIFRILYFSNKFETKQMVS